MRAGARRHAGVIGGGAPCASKRLVKRAAKAFAAISCEIADVFSAVPAEGCSIDRKTMTAARLPVGERAAAVDLSDVKAHTPTQGAHDPSSASMSCIATSSRARILDLAW